MTDNAERWRNVAQAAQWLAEGREVEMRWRNPVYRRDGEKEWNPCEAETPGFVFVLRPDHEYRLKPEPPKPREWVLARPQFTLRPFPIAISGDFLEEGKTVRVREVIE